MVLTKAINQEEIDFERPTVQVLLEEDSITVKIGQESDIKLGIKEQTVGLLTSYNKLVQRLTYCQKVSLLLFSEKRDEALLKELSLAKIQLYDEI